MAIAIAELLGLEGPQADTVIDGVSIRALQAQLQASVQEADEVLSAIAEVTFVRRGCADASCGCGRTVTVVSEQALQGLRFRATAALQAATEARENLRVLGIDAQGYEYADKLRLRAEPSALAGVTRVVPQSLFEGLGLYLPSACTAGVQEEEWDHWDRDDWREEEEVNPRSTAGLHHRLAREVEEGDAVACALLDLVEARDGLDRAERLPRYRRDWRGRSYSTGYLGLAKEAVARAEAALAQAYAGLGSTEEDDELLDLTVRAVRGRVLAQDALLGAPAPSFEPSRKTAGARLGGSVVGDPRDRSWKRHRRQAYKL
jgi:hypothetical protein